MPFPVLKLRTGFLRSTYGVGGEVREEGGAVAVAYGDEGVFADDDTVALDHVSIVHVYYIRTVNLQERSRQLLFDGGERTQGDKRIVLVCEEYLKVFSVALNVADIR